ncbi:caspase family protein [Rhizobium leguminosarum]|uniref:caspase family protein n=1 Tax=Rhizobium leguminosarum TaxID=384 RepID=UPI001C9631C5|nr:caspase family protein [Rhizobium leguminosarum]MBY5560558.1 caspase family protein [Rhizobium leguminosarum]MBY5708920.1 caspase family protein [Rhizobium leguminosarum]
MPDVACHSLRLPGDAHSALLLAFAPGSEVKVTCAVSDARRIDATLKQRGFVTTLLEDPDGPAISTSLSAFQAKATKADIALIYLAGHSVERSGSGYFLPRDFPFPVTALAAKLYGISIGDAVETVTRSLRMGGSRPSIAEAHQKSSHYGQSNLKMSRHSWANIVR